MFPPVSLFSFGCFCVILVSNKPTSRFLQSLDEGWVAAQIKPDLDDETNPGFFFLNVAVYNIFGHFS